ncbi:hypothetical protein Tco_0774071 [Tanacetum coccineum]|uniref:Uncharacterized protein n=1 Tax=Tanacetum coccineum TaxID=301880 RepID=A0ABQ4ZQX9_9ASTR
MFPPLTANEEQKPSLTEAEIWGTTSTDVCDGGRSMEVLFEHCFNRLRPEVQSQMAPATTSLTGFSGETIWPVGQIRLLVTIGDAEHSTEAWMNFMDFPVKGGVVTIRSTIVSPMECATVTATPKNIEEKTKKCPENFQVAIHPDFPNQEISIGDTLSPKGERNNVTLKKKPRHIRMSPILTYRCGKSLQGAKTTFIQATNISSTKTAGGIDNVLVRLSWSGWRSPNNKKGYGPDASIFY